MNDNRNIKQSNIFERNSSPPQKKKINKSMSPFSDLPGMSLKGSIMPLGNFGEIKEENEEYNSINDNNKEKSKSTNINNINYNPEKNEGHIILKIKFFKFLTNNDLSK